MYNRRDQVQAHSFLENRLVAALLRAEPDGVEKPMRRTPMGVAGGALIALLVVAGVLVFTILSPRGKQNWREPGALVVDKGTGASFVVADGTLRPVLNYASARLLLGAQPKVVVVSSKTLDGVPRGNPVGIVGAPDALPSPGPDAVRTWSVCAITVPDERGLDQPGVALAIDLPRGEPAAPDTHAVLVRAPDGSLHVAWRDRRLRVTDERMLRALDVDPGSALPVRDSWLDALPAGPDLVVPPIARGGAGPVVDGRPTTTGQLLVVPGPVLEQRYYVVAPGGLVPATALVGALLLGDPATAQAYGDDAVEAIEVSPTAVAEATVLPAPAWQAELPPVPPTMTPARSDGDPGAGVPCVRTVTGPQAAGPMLVVAPEPGGPTAGRDGPGVSRDAAVADRVVVAAGAGLLVRSAPAPGVAGAGVHLVTEAGVRFPIGSADAAAALGVPVDTASPLPAPLAALLPTGPLLDIVPTGDE